MCGTKQAKLTWPTDASFAYKVKSSSMLLLIALQMSLKTHLDSLCIKNSTKGSLENILFIQQEVIDNPEERFLAPSSIQVFFYPPRGGSGDVHDDGSLTRTKYRSGTNKNMYNAQALTLLPPLQTQVVSKFTPPQCLSRGWSLWAEVAMAIHLHCERFVCPGSDEWTVCTAAEAASDFWWIGTATSKSQCCTTEYLVLGHHPWKGKLLPEDCILRSQ